MRLPGFILLAALFWGGAATAQDAVSPQVLIIDSDRLYIDSAYGRAIRAELEQAAVALQAENDTIQARLIEEERSLTERRPTMSVDDFRAEAAAFDEKVQDIRRARDAKIAELEQARTDGRDQFYDDVRGIVGRLMLDRGAVVLLDRRSVFLALGSADVTALAIARIDGELMAPPATNDTNETSGEDGLIEPAPETTP